VRVTPEVSGRVQDARTGKPVEGAIVVVRFDARYDDLLPDRDVIGHRELISAADGSFALGRSAEAGFAAWPYVRTETRVVGVIADGYRCPAPRVAPSGSALVVELAPAQDEEERRETCRPLGARALSPDGRHVAWNVERGAAQRIEVRATAAAEKASAPLQVPAERIGHRLAWTSHGELLLWEPASELQRSLSLSALATGTTPPEVLWRAGRRAAPPASAARDARPRPVEPSDLRDEGDSRWGGRSFHLMRSLEPETGLARERLRIRSGGRELAQLDLPGEACGPRGEFGLPQLRIAADAKTAFDLRDAGEGCGVVAIDLGTGAWRRLDRAGAGTCAASRQVPATHFQTAMRGYAIDVEEKLVAAGADPMSAFSLRLGADGSAEAISRNYAGETIRARVPEFPVRTPLRRIDVGVLGASGGTGPTPVPRMEPL
jgi:hypothetical protein